MRILGIEEAGRGPVIGNLVMCGLLFREERLPELEAIKVKDSKLLTPSQRTRLFSKILGLVEEYKIIQLTPQEIDAAVTSETSNLNWLEAQKMADLINAFKPDKALIDCPSPNIPAFTAHLRKRLAYQPELTVAHKADVKYPIVSAASIIAKVTRDREIAKLKQKLKIDFGSGYPADPLTQKFLKEHAQDFPGIFRTSWAPYRKVLLEKKQRSLDAF